MRNRPPLRREERMTVFRMTPRIQELVPANNQNRTGIIKRHMFALPRSAYAIMIENQASLVISIVYSLIHYGCGFRGEHAAIPTTTESAYGRT